MATLNLRGIFLHDCNIEQPKKLEYAGADSVSIDDLITANDLPLSNISPVKVVEFINSKFTNYLTNESKSQSMEKWPPYYINNDLWPKKSSFQCMHCSLRIHERPLFIPTSISMRNIRASIVGADTRIVGAASSDYVERLVFEKYGKFGSFPCAAAYIETTIDRELNNISAIRRWELQSMLLTLYKHMTGGNIRHIPHAPKKSDLLRYGGELTDEQYHQQCDMLMR